MSELAVVLAGAFIIAIVICVSVWKKDSGSKPKMTYEQISRQVQRQDEELLKLLDNSEEDDQEDIE